MSTAFEKRALAFTEEKARQQALWIKQHKDGNTKPIEILLPDGSKRTGAAGSTTPLEIAQGKALTSQKPFALQDFRLMPYGLFLK